jgi:hypothetical protein
MDVPPITEGRKGPRISRAPQQPHHFTKRKRSTISIRLSCIATLLLLIYAVFIYSVVIIFDNGGGNQSETHASSSSLLRRKQHNSTSSILDETKQPTGMEPLPTKESSVSPPLTPTIDDFCGLCQWRDQNFNCNERVSWVVKQKGLSEVEAKLSNLQYCINSGGCENIEMDDMGFGRCEDTRSSLLSSTSITTTKVASKAHVEKEPELEDLLSGALLKRATTIVSHDVENDRVVNQNDGLRDSRRGEEIVKSVLTAARYGDRQYDTTDGNFAESSSLSDHSGGGSNDDRFSTRSGRKSNMPVLTAYCEPVNQTTWETKPLPIRDGPTTKSQLFPIEYPHVQSCSTLSSQWPIDTPPVDLDPFLPWIHDVFPSEDGQNVIFISQNRRRCFNGQRTLRDGERIPKGVITHNNDIHIDYAKNYFMRPQSALFQHIPVKRIVAEEDATSSKQEEGDDDEEVGSEPRYRLASHEDADADGMETRFICRFKSYNLDENRISIVGYSLSKFLVDYDYHTYRKGYKFSATEGGYDNHMIWQSQLIFKCPVPTSWHERVQNGETVIDDYATLFVDVVPIRTAPRYTSPREFLQPRYEFKNEIENLFVPDWEWGKDHMLPRIDESGRWENIPVCMPSLMTYGIVPKHIDVKSLTIPDNESDKKYVVITGELPPKIHKVIACTWASSTFRTRSNRAQVDDGNRRLQEWLEFNLLSGFDHIYVYDNSGAFTNEDSLAETTNLFPPDKVTRVDWPCKICSNRDGNEGERSSQYAAESSCRLRFGSHSRWLGSFDSDEYLVPMGEFKSMGEVADELDRKEVKVAVFKSAPSKPRFDLLE